MHSSLRLPRLRISTSTSTASAIFGIVGIGMAFVSCLALFALAYGALAITFGAGRLRQPNRAAATGRDWAAIAGVVGGCAAIALTGWTLYTMMMSMSM